MGYRNGLPQLLLPLETMCSVLPHRTQNHRLQNGNLIPPFAALLGSSALYT